MKILHIAGAAIMDKFYQTFFTKLFDMGYPCDVYSAFDNNRFSVEEQNEVELRYREKHIGFYAAPIKTPLDRFMYKTKIKKFTKDLLHTININDYYTVHAHSLYSDGGVAYELFKQYQIPYFVAIRTTDTNYFMKYYPWLNGYAREIIENAKAVFYISGDIKKSVIENLYNGKSGTLADEGCIVPNGIDDFWIKHKAKEHRRRQPYNKCIKLIHVSRLLKVKRVDLSILAVVEMKKRGWDPHLDIVGDGEEYDYLLDFVKKHGLESNVSLKGKITIKDELLKLYYDEDVFLMLSENETFGISYIEAISQGVPIIGRSGTGVSSYFSSVPVGVFISNDEPVHIADAIENVINNYEDYSHNCLSQVGNFDWKYIIMQYCKLYDEIKEKSK